MTTVLDISLPITEDLPTFPGNPRPLLEPVMRRTGGDEADVSRVSLGTHTGTHVDAPNHLLDGAPGVDRLALDILVGEALVIDLRSVVQMIEAPDLARAGIPVGQLRVLLRTSGSALWRRAMQDYPNDYVALGQTGARWLVDHGVRLVGIDALSIEPFDTAGRPTHRMLLSAGVIIVEGLDLSAVAAGGYRLVCLPLRLVGADGAPARAILIQEHGPMPYDSR